MIKAWVTKLKIIRHHPAYLFYNDYYTCVSAEHSMYIPLATSVATASADFRSTHFADLSFLKSIFVPTKIKGAS